MNKFFLFLFFLLIPSISFAQQSWFTSILRANEEAPVYPRVGRPYFGIIPIAKGSDNEEIARKACEESYGVNGSFNGFNPGNSTYAWHWTGTGWNLASTPAGNNYIRYNCTVPDTPNTYNFPSNARRSDVMAVPQSEWCIFSQDTITVGNYGMRIITDTDSTLVYECYTNATPKKRTKTINYPVIPVSGYFNNNNVIEYGSLTWNMTITTSEAANIESLINIQLWNKFKVVSIVPNADNKTITLTLRQFDDKPVNVACTSYSVYVPENAIKSTVDNISTNITPVIGQFTVVGCPHNTDMLGSSSGSNQNDSQAPKYTHSGNISDNASYVSVIATDNDGNSYVSIGGLIFILGIVSVFLYLFWGVLIFIKNSFLGKK